MLKGEILAQIRVDKTTYLNYLIAKLMSSFSPTFYSFQGGQYWSNIEVASSSDEVGPAMRLFLSSKNLDGDI